MAKKKSVNRCSNLLVPARLPPSSLSKSLAGRLIKRQPDRQWHVHADSPEAVPSRSAGTRTGGGREKKKSLNDDETAVVESPILPSRTHKAGVDASSFRVQTR